jgi:hypothetical protein
MRAPVDFVTVSTSGLESSPHAEMLAGLRANEARYFKNKYDAVFETMPVAEGIAILERVSSALLERDIVIASPPLEVAEMLVEGIRWSHVFYESGLSINLLYNLEDPKKRAIGFKLSMGMDVPDELVNKFKFARQKSKLAGEIRGSFFVVKGEYA